jgi:alanine dehydrogenase
MRIGVPKEIKAAEGRVGLTPAGVRELTGAGHRVFVERGAGAAAGISDDAFVAQGAQVAPDAEEVFESAELIVKVKEPQAAEIARLRSHHTLFCYLHLAPDPDQAAGLMSSGATCVAFETVEDALGRLPLLAPMSEVAGRIAAQVGAFYLQSPAGGPGVLMGGVPGARRARVMVLGGGVVGENAALIAAGMQAEVTVFDTSLPRLRELDALSGGRLKTTHSSALAIEEALPHADLVIGAVLLRGARAPRLITRDMLGLLPAGAVLVDVAIDQGGCFETSRPTTHDQPTYTVDGILHYCVANMPGAVPATSAHALASATLPYVRAIADHGVWEALRRDPGLMRGLNVADGAITHEAVADALGCSPAAATPELLTT